MIENLNLGIKEAEENTSQLENIINKVVKEYSEDLDKLLRSVGELNNTEIELTNKELEKAIFSISNTLYFVAPRIEKIGIRQSVAKILKNEMYNKSYIQNDIGTLDPNGKKVKPTIATNQALSEESSKLQEAIQIMYESAYKTLKSKIDAAYEQLSSLKKVLSSRMLEMQLTMNTANKPIQNNFEESRDTNDIF